MAKNYGSNYRQRVLGRSNSNVKMTAFYIGLFLGIAYVRFMSILRYQLYANIIGLIIYSLGEIPKLWIDHNIIEGKISLTHLKFYNVFQNW